MANPVSLMIDTQYVYDNTFIEANVDVKLVAKAIIIAQQINIQKALGYDLYTYIMGLIADGTITSDPSQSNYLFLLQNLISPALAYWTHYTILPYINWHLTNKSVNTKHTDTSNTAGEEDVSKLEQRIRSIAEYSVQRIREYILNNVGFYPQYFQTTGVDRITPKPINYDDSIYLSTSTPYIPPNMIITSDLITGGGTYF